MKKLYTLAFATLMASPALAGPYDSAIDMIPSVTAICGAVPETPVRVLRSSGLRSLNKAAKRYVVATRDWVACSQDASGQTRAILNDMSDGDAKIAVIDHLNADYRAQYDTLNTQLERFRHRANFADGQISPSSLLLRTREPRCHGTIQQQHLCFLRSSVLQTHFRTEMQQRIDEPIRIEKQTRPTFGR